MAIGNLQDAWEQLYDMIYNPSGNWNRVAGMPGRGARSRPKPVEPNNLIYDKKRTGPKEVTDDPDYPIKNK